MEEMREKISKPIIYEYHNYRLYLSNLFEYFKEIKPAFSYRFFSKQAGFRSPNFLKLVIEGKRNLSGESIEKFSLAFKLNQKEKDYFRNLVQLNQATTIEEKAYYSEQIFKSSAYRKINPLKKEQHDYYTNWYYIAIREMVDLPNFKNDPNWIANHLRPKTSPQDAEKALSELEKLGLIQKDRNGKYEQIDQIVSTGDEVASNDVAKFLQLMSHRGAESIDLIPAPQRDISAVTVTLSEKNFLKIKQLIQDFRKQLLQIAQEEQSAEAVYQINFHIFPLTEILKIEEKNKGQKGVQTNKKTGDKK